MKFRLNGWINNKQGEGPILNMISEVEEFGLFSIMLFKKDTFARRDEIINFD